MLWRSNPTLANLDGLIDYGDDYTNAATVVPNLKTLYRVGKGMFTDEELEAEERKRAGLPPLEPETSEEAVEPETAPDGEEGAEEGAGAPPLVDETEQAPVIEELPPAAGETPGPSGQAEQAESGQTRPSSKPVEKKRSALARRWGGDPDSAA